MPSNSALLGIVSSPSRLMVAQIRRAVAAMSEAYGGRTGGGLRGVCWGCGLPGEGWEVVVCPVAIGIRPTVALLTALIAALRLAPVH